MKPLPLNYRNLIGLAITVLSVFAFFAEAVWATWPVRHGDGRNSGWLPLAGPAKLVPKWHSLDKIPVATFVAIGNEGNLYTLTMDAGPCHLYALDRNGKVRWCSDRVKAASSSVAVADVSGKAEDEAVFVIDGKNLFRFESDGKLTWEVPVSEGASALMFARQGYLLVANLKGAIAIYDPSTGKQVAQPYQIPSAPTADRSLPAAAKLGMTKIGIDPNYVEEFLKEFLGINVTLKDAVAVHPITGRIFTKGSNSTGTTGMLYALDFIPPDGGVPGAIKGACTAPMGLGSDTTPTLSADGDRVYVTDEGGTLFAFNTKDCSLAWSIKVPGAAPAAPAVAPNGRLYALTGGKITAFQDNGSSGKILWETDIAKQAESEGFVTGAFDSALTLTQNYLYATASFGTPQKGVGNNPMVIPKVSRLVTINPSDGSIVSIADLGDESDSTPSLGDDGTLYVPSKPLKKGVALGLKALGILPQEFSIPEPRGGVYAFEPASFKQLAVDGLNVANNFISQAGETLDRNNNDRSITELKWAKRQLVAISQNLKMAVIRNEVLGKTADEAAQYLREADRKLDRAVRGLDRKQQFSERQSLLSSAQQDIDRAIQLLSGSSQTLRITKHDFSNQRLASTN